MSEIRFISVDASMSNVGLALGHWNSDNTYLVDRIHLIRTDPSTEKQVRKSSQDYERCRKLYIKMHEFFEDWNPSISFAEMPTGSQSANGMKSYGISLMLLGTIKVPVIQVTPMEVKVAALNNKQASKKQMIDWAVAKWPHLTWPRYRRNGEDLITEGEAEHMADACATAEAAMRTNQWLQLVSIIAGQSSAPRVII